ncbi:hypothetical protein [Antribacter gilvus]|uniref:hypothetical protein n=1 Tax=Antribacter gilvus TaxID=2304675 RepID=UPI000F776E11|nr:hypothetical protein [Antribacter gilvus]
MTTLPENPVEAPAAVGWWRRNAVWLVLLPVALVVAAGASSFRIWAFWWPNGLHHEIQHVGAGETARHSEEYYDVGFQVPERANTWVQRDVEVEVLSVTRVDELPEPDYGDPVPVPDGAVPYLVSLRLAAVPRTDLALCTIVLLGDDGARYGEKSPDVLGSSNRCLPPDADDPLSTEPEWSITSPILVDEDAVITEVRFGFGGPGYVTFDVP